MTTLDFSAFETLRRDHSPLDLCDNLRVRLDSNRITFTNVTPGSLAAELGIKEGDAIVKLNGIAASDPLALLAQLPVIAVTRTADLRLENGGSQRTLRIFLF